MVASSQTKRVLLFVATGVFVLGLLVGLYFMFSGSGGGVGVSPNPFVGAGDKEPTGGVVSGPIEGAGTVVAPRLMRITEGPVAHGALAMSITVPGVSTSTSGLEDTEIRYIERKSGNVYAFRLHDRTLTRISNKTLPGIIDAAWFRDGSQVLARFVSNEGGADTVATYALRASGGDGYFLEPGLAGVGITASSTIYTLSSGTGGSVVSTIAPGTGTVATAFSSPLSAISVQPFGDTDFVIATKPSREIDGYVFWYSGKAKASSRILGPFAGLSVLPDPTGKMVLFSYVYRGKVLLAVQDVGTRTVTQLPVATLAEKCTWTPNGLSIYCGVPTALSTDLPDAWYQGAQHFTDRLWNIDMGTRLATLIVDPLAVAETAIDMVALTVDPAEDALIFTNKTDGSLWAYDF
jgi:hypothetical protein